MTFLPIVDRELRVTARRPGSYRLRLAVALTAMFLAGIIFVVNLGAPQPVGAAPFRRTVRLLHYLLFVLRENFHRGLA